MESIEDHRRHAVEVFLQMPDRVVDLPIRESPDIPGEGGRGLPQSTPCL